VKLRMTFLRLARPSPATPNRAPYRG
jgi:hypothetical protein